MIDPELVDRLTPDVARELKVALGIVWASGILRAQRDELMKNLLIGADDEKPGQLAARILEMRKRVNLLSELTDVCERFYEEMNHNA